MAFVSKAAKAIVAGILAAVNLFLYFTGAEGISEDTQEKILLAVNSVLPLLVWLIPNRPDPKRPEGKSGKALSSVGLIAILLIPGCAVGGKGMAIMGAEITQADRVVTCPDGRTIATGSVTTTSADAFDLSGLIESLSALAEPILGAVLPAGLAAFREGEPVLPADVPAECL